MVSGPRDYVREANRAANLVLEKVSEYKTYFADQGSRTYRLAPGNKVPRHLYRPYRAPVADPMETALKSTSDAVSGANRFKFSNRPLFLQALDDEGGAAGGRPMAGAQGKKKEKRKTNAPLTIDVPLFMYVHRQLPLNYPVLEKRLKCSRMNLITTYV